MFHRQQVKVLAVQMLAFISLWPETHDCLIITSVLAGDKKFKTISFDSKLLKPLMFEKEMPSTEFRRHRTVRPPKFDIDVNIPIKLPLEDEYAKEEPRKPIESNIFFQSGEIREPGYGKKSKGYAKKQKPVTYKDDMVASASNVKINQQQPDTLSSRQSDETEQRTRQTSSEFAPAQTANIVYQEDAYANQQQTDGTSGTDFSNDARSDPKDLQEARQEVIASEASDVDYSGSKGYNQQYHSSGEYQQEFVPGGYVNLQLSGPSGGPKITYADYDRERWAQQLSQTEGAMPYPILNYQQLQNFYGGLGTFTNGLAENRYMPTSLMDKLKSGISHFTNKFNFGFSH